MLSHCGGALAPTLAPTLTSCVRFYVLVLARARGDRLGAIAHVALVQGRTPGAWQGGHDDVGANAEHERRMHGDRHVWVTLTHGFFTTR